MIRARDPTAMALDERIAALAAMLATGYLRLSISRQKELDLADPAEAPCEAVVNSVENDPRKETA
jgi:hypothetical protein